MGKQGAIHSRQEIMMLLEICSNAGALLLKYGAEIYRVEDTVDRIIRSRENVKNVDVYSTLNVLIVSFNIDGQFYSNVRRVKERTTDLNRINMINSFSRDFCGGKYTLNEALPELDKIEKAKGFSKYYELFGAALSAAAFTVLLKGTFYEGFIAFFVGLISWAAKIQLDKNNLGYFIDDFLAGIIVSSLTLIFNSFLHLESMDHAFIGAMMPYVPGFTMTNAVRDLMGGDTTTGLTGIAQAFLISAALAVGVALPIGISRVM